MDKILITGASGALGTEVCKVFLEAGNEVIAIIKEHPLPDFLTTSKKLYVYKCNLTNEEDVRKVFSDISLKHERINAGLFLAGGYEGGNFANTDLTALQHMLTLNFESAFHISRQLYNRMVEWGGGRLVFMGARPALESKAGTEAIAYSLSKSLVLKLSDLYNAAGKKHHIVSAAFLPSVIDTPANRKAMPDADFNKWVAPGIIAKNILFFVSGEGTVLREGIFKVYGDA